MTEQSSALAALRERVSTLTGPISDHDAYAWAREAGFEGEQKVALAKALLGSLDAAAAFTEALLPGYRWTREIDGTIIVWEPEPHPTDKRQTAWEGVGHAHKPTPALALVLAALKAYQEKENT